MRSTVYYSLIESRGVTACILSYFVYSCTCTRVIRRVLSVLRGGRPEGMDCHLKKIVAHVTGLHCILETDQTYEFLR